MLLAACTDSPVAARPAPSSVDSSNNSVASITLSQLPPGMVGGMRHLLSATVKARSGADLPGRLVAWKTNNPSVATVAVLGGGTVAEGIVFANQDGVATITVSAGDFSASTTVNVISNPPITNGLAIDAFSIIEFQYGSGPDYWHYAPKLRVRERTGAGYAQVIGVQLDIPDVGPTALCSTNRVVVAGQSDEMFREIYGDFELSFYKSNGARATPGQASATVFVRDEGGRFGRVTVTGPVVEGTLPTSYSGGRINNPWHC